MPHHNSYNYYNTQYSHHPQSGTVQVPPPPAAAEVFNVETAEPTPEDLETELDYGAYSNYNHSLVRAVVPVQPAVVKKSYYLEPRPAVSVISSRSSRSRTTTSSSSSRRKKEKERRREEQQKQNEMLKQSQELLNMLKEVRSDPHGADALAQSGLARGGSL